MFEDDDDYESTSQKVDKMPIYQKGLEILDLVRNIADLIDDENSQLGFTKGLMLEDAYMLTAKIVNAEGGDMYAIRMENAAIIRRAGNNLKLHIHTLRMFGFEHTEYYTMVRQKVEEYRVLFIDWVASIDKTNYFIDDWGLFNPPGVVLPDDARIAHDDYDPDRTNDFFNELFDEDDE
jgi:hypothetical protein